MKWLPSQAQGFRSGRPLAAHLLTTEPAGHLAARPEADGASVGALRVSVRSQLAES